jgi:hypothetical protein
MAQYSPGELKKFYYILEETYGTTPPVGDVATMTWGCDVVSLKPTINANKEFHTLESSTYGTYGSVTRGGWEIGYTLEGLAHAESGTYDWTDFWGVYGWGGAAALARHLDSFTAQVGKTVSSLNYYDFYNGCKINKLTISCDGPGKLIKFKADVMCRWVDQDTDKAITGLQALTVGANPTDITSAILTWTGASTVNIAAGGATAWYPRKWEVVVDNHLERMMGNITGADSAQYSATYALSEGLREITFTCDLPYEGETYTAAKLASSAITAIKITIDSTATAPKVLTLTTGELMVDGDDWPEYKHELMDEPVRIKFKTLTTRST